MKVLRYHLIFKGRVQGVGFRFTTQRFASKYGLSGWVRNNPEGTVEAVVEGQEKKLELFLEDLKRYFQGYISDYQKKVLPATGEFKDFRIVFF